MKTIEEIIEKISKIDKKYIDYQPRSNPKNPELEFEIYRPAVLVEKIGNKDKGVVTGPNVMYHKVLNCRKQRKDDTNVFKMWAEGKIPGSVLVTTEAGFVSNQLNGETFFGCWYPWKDDFTGLEYLFHQ